MVSGTPKLQERTTLTQTLYNEDVHVIRIIDTTDFNIAITKGETNTRRLLNTSTIYSLEGLAF